MITGCGNSGEELISELLKNLLQALAVTKTLEYAATMTLPAKVPRINEKKTKSDYDTSFFVLQDPFRTFVHLNEWETLTDPIPESVGRKLTMLTLAGLMNGLSGTQGGVVDAKSQQIDVDGNSSVQGQGSATATVAQIRAIATRLYFLVRTRMELDQIKALPHHIQLMLSPDLESAQFQSIRRRVRNTVVLGKGLDKPTAQESVVPLVVSLRQIPSIEKDMKCKLCGNLEQSSFVLDRKNGDIICTSCGVVACESIIHEGLQYRKFEGEEDRNHSGDVFNELFSNAYNTSTTFGRGVFSPSGGSASATKGTQGAHALRKTHNFIEMNISNFNEGSVPRKQTREGYKDRQKKDIFSRMQHVGNALDLNAAVIERAKAMFSCFRDKRQNLTQADGVAAACLCEAFEEFSSDGIQMLSERLKSFEPRISRRVLRRDLLHKTCMASSREGNDLTSENRFSSKDGTSVNATSASKLERKSLEHWDMCDARSWLLQTSHSLSRRLMASEDDDKGNSVPGIPPDEIDNRLIQHTMDLCEYLEEHSGTNPGKSLLLLNRKKLKYVMGDPKIAELVHCQIRGLVKRQQARRARSVRQAASHVRFQQIKRKHWMEVKKQDAASLNPPGLLQVNVETK